MSTTGRLAMVVALIGACTRAADAQSWRLRLDAAAQRVEFRGLTPDSVAESLARPGATGGLESPDGFEVSCIGDGFCRFYRAGPVRTGLPASAGLDLTLWGLGVQGLSVRINARALTDFTGDQLWPGTSPAVRLVEGYAEYLRDGLTVQGGRTLERGRLASVGSSGLDGIRASWLFNRSTIEVGAYGGLGMARGTILSVNSPAVDPLADFQPSSRQIVAGVLAGIRLPALDVQAEYRREVDPATDYMVAERAALSFQGRASRHLRIVAGVDYDIAQAAWGSAEVTTSFTGPRLSATLGARHYRPFFDLWTVWGAFSPVPYNGISGSVTANPTSKLQLRSRLEWFKYDAADVSTPEVTLLDRGWRWALEGTMALREHWTVELDTHGEQQPGASSSGMDGRITWQAASSLDLSFGGGSLARPLELRFQDAGVTYASFSAAYRVDDRWRIDAGIDRYWDTRDRPDAAAFDWNQWRLSTRVSLTLRSQADSWLPKARPAVTPP